ncbi:MAG: hypothetical protein GXY01_07975 [Clostridiales bacterium]|jgi:hypothetical protein|nr:hypothetical protein [Clostridiales bacterium]
MEIFEIVTAFVLSLSFLMLLWTIKGLLLRPVTVGKNSKVTVIITAGEKAQSLEREISGLRWLKEGGILRADVLIVDFGMDDETAEIASALSENDSSVLVCSPGEIESIITRSSGNGGKR